MKASILRKEILSFVVLFVCSLAMSAASPRNYLYDIRLECPYRLNQKDWKPTFIPFAKASLKESFNENENDI